MARRPRENAPEVEMASRADLRRWLAAYHGQATGVWPVSYRKSDPARYVSYDDIVAECLCFGWVDSLPRAKDEARSMLWIAPRRPGSNWSKANKDRVARLEAAGLMTDADRRLVEIAKADGGWARLDAVEVPDDRAATFTGFPGAHPNWNAFPPSVRRDAFEWIVNTKRPETLPARRRNRAPCRQEPSPPARAPRLSGTCHNRAAPGMKTSILRHEMNETFR